MCWGLTFLTMCQDRLSMANKLLWIERIAVWMDSRYRVPGTQFRFGLDPILSLFPALGNVISYVISGVLIVHMVRYGASGAVVVKMILNICFDFLISNIPVLGTLFTAGYKANNRNVRLLKEHYREGKHRGSGMRLVVMVVATLVLLSFLLLALLIFVLVELIHWIESL